jgi:hypothetical protein
MREHDLRQEINRLQGALDVLGLVRERLLRQRDELGGETAREAVDEMLTHVDALQNEYSRRRAELHPHHKSYQFFLTDAGVLPIRHDCYVDLVTGKAISSELAGQTVRLADWYVRMQDDMPQEVVNETYTWLVLDEFGRADLHAARAIDASQLPSHDEHEEIHRRLFAPAL